MSARWLHDDLSRPLEAPLTSTPRDRSPERLALVVGQFAPAFAGRYRRRDVDGNGTIETFCNFFLVDVARAMGCPVPQMRANDLIMWFAGDEARKAGWHAVDASTAQLQADAGQLAVPTWFNRNGGPGHLGVLVPSLGESGRWMAQAGLTNFLREPVESGFGARELTYFAHV